MKRTTLAVAMALALAFMGSSAGFASASEPAISTKETQQCTNLFHPGVAVGVLDSGECDEWELLILPNVNEEERPMVVQNLFLEATGDDGLEWALLEDGVAICNGDIDRQNRLGGCTFDAEMDAGYVLQVNNPKEDSIQTYSSVASPLPV